MLKESMVFHQLWCVHQIRNITVEKEKKKKVIKKKIPHTRDYSNSRSEQIKAAIH